MHELREQLLPRIAGEEDPNVEYIRCSSPPCFAHEFELDGEELLSFLNVLVEGERAGARAASRFANDLADGRLASALRDVARDEARFCASLMRHVRRLGGTPSDATGPFYAKAVALTGLEERLAFLNRGQTWVVNKLRETLPQITDKQLCVALREMLDVHERNVARCTELLKTEGVSAVSTRQHKDMRVRRMELRETGPAPRYAWRWLLIAALSVTFLLLAVDRVKRNPLPASPSIDVAQQHRLTAALQDATVNLGEERGMVYYALHAPEPIVAELQAEIDQRRGLSESAIDDVATRARRGSSLALRGYAGVLANERAARFSDLRRKVDAELARPRAERDPDIATRWFVGATHFMRTVEDLRSSTQIELARAGSLNPSVFKLQHHLWRIHDYAGRERAIIGAAVAASASLTPTQLQQLRSYRSLILSDWQQVVFLTKTMQFNPQAIAAADGVRERFFKDYEATRAMMYRAGVRGEYPLTPARWFAEATHGIESITALGRAAADSKETRLASSLNLGDQS